MNVKSADRTLLIFEAFADRQAPMTLSELARLLDIPVSTCFNLMRTLEARGYLYEVAGRKMYYPTARWLVNAQGIARRDPVREQVEPFLIALRDATAETVILGKRLGDKVVYLNIIESEQSIRYTAAAGDLKPMHSTSAGRALLGAMSTPEREKLLAELPLEPVTGATLIDPADLRAEIEAGVLRGWFSSRGENVVDVAGIAAFVNFGADVFTVTVAGPRQRVEPKIESHAARLVATCRSILGAAAA
jgi:DNA-binding IclR family transcriptional regulator